MQIQIVSNEGRTNVRSEPWQLRVLVAEDNGALRQLMADVLTYEGYNVTQAANAAEMQRAIRQPEPGRRVEDAFDLIVSDVFMPGKSGLDALSELRQTGLRSPFLVVTAFPEAATQRRIDELGVQLLVKPFSLREFRTVATTMLLPQVPNSESTL